MGDIWTGDRTWHLPFEAPEEAAARTYRAVKDFVLSDDVLRRIVRDANEYVDEYEFHVRARSRRRRAGGFVDADDHGRIVRSSPIEAVRFADPRRTVFARITSLLARLSIDSVNVDVYPLSLARQVLEWGRTRWVVCNVHVNMMDDLLLMDAWTQWHLLSGEAPDSEIRRRHVRADTLTADVALNCEAPSWSVLIYALRPLTAEERGAYLEARARIADRILAMRAAEALRDLGDRHEAGRAGL